MAGSLTLTGTLVRLFNIETTRFYLGKYYILAIILRNFIGLKIFVISQRNPPFLLMPDEWEEERKNNRTPNFTVNLWTPKEYYNCPQVRLKLYTLQIEGYCTREGLIHNNIVLCLLEEKKKIEI